MQATFGRGRDAQTGVSREKSLRARGGIPRLLVSVRDRTEGAAAISAGAEVLDLKDPDRGSLGMAHMADIRDIVGEHRVSTPLTAALGETGDWLTMHTFPALPAELACVKLGLAGMRRCTDWKSDWIRVRTEFDAAAAVRLDWVAVAYADCDLADSPDADAVIDAAATTGCRGILIDTFSKSSGSLLTSVTIDALRAWTSRAHQSELFMALAGRLSVDDIPQLSSVPADVIAIRSAACIAGQRGGRIAAELVAAFKRRLARDYSRAVDRCGRWRRDGAAGDDDHRS
jgi:uncharacterized protein (UPF0264 family)